MSKFVSILLLGGVLVISPWCYSQRNAQFQPIHLRSQMDQKIDMQQLANYPSSFENSLEAINWMTHQSLMIKSKLPDEKFRWNLLHLIHLESKRSGLNPDLVLALIDVESQFNRFALSPVGASGLMQVMPFWKKILGNEEDSLFEIGTNLRYGCTILKYYLIEENNNLERALARYNGSLGSTKYPDLIFSRLNQKFRHSTN